MIFAASEAILKRADPHEPTFDEMMRCIREELDSYRVSKPSSSKPAAAGSAARDATQISAQ